MTAAIATLTAVRGGDRPTARRIAVEAIAEGGDGMTLCLAALASGIIELASAALDVDGDDLVKLVAGRLSQARHIPSAVDP